MSGNAVRLSELSLRRQILQLCNAFEGAKFRFGSGKIQVSDDQHHHIIEFEKMPVNAEEYVLHACETYDPPTKPFDENGQRKSSRHSSR